MMFSQEYLEAMCLWFSSQFGKTCFYCSAQLTTNKKHLRSPIYRTSDHVVPLCDDGWVTVPSCRPCNESKANLNLEEFRTLRYAGKPVEFFGESTYRIMREVHSKMISERASQPANSEGGK